MRPLEKWGEQALKEIGRPEARLATKVVRLEKANQLQRKRGDVPRACPVETPATGAQLAATGAKSPPGWASCFAMQGQCAAGAGRPSHLRGYCSRLAGKIGSETPECQGEGRTAFIGGTSGVKPSSFAAFRTVWRVQIREKGHKRFYPVTEGRARRPLKRLCPVCWRIHNRSLTANIIKFFVKKHRIQLKLTGSSKTNPRVSWCVGLIDSQRKRLHSPKVLLGYTCRGLVCCCQAPPRVFPVL